MKDESVSQIINIVLIFIAMVVTSGLVASFSFNAGISQGRERAIADLTEQGRLDFSAGENVDQSGQTVGNSDGGVQVNPGTNVDDINQQQDIPTSFPQSFPR